MHNQRDKATESAIHAVQKQKIKRMVLKRPTGYPTPRFIINHYGGRLVKVDRNKIKSGFRIG